MDILNAEIVEIKGRCYRKLPIKGQTKHNPEEDDIVFVEKEEKFQRDDEYDHLPIKREGSRFYASIPIPGSIVGYVNGKHSKTRKNIQDRTHTTIKIPETREEDGDITIVGDSKPFVAQAYEEIFHMISDRRLMNEYTHFVSIPMNNNSIVEGYHKFKNEVLRKFKARGVSDNIFVPASRLHLTLSMLVLLTGRETKTASVLLQQCKDKILDLLQGEPLQLVAKGVEYMNDDRAEVDVLFAQVVEADGDNRLQAIANTIADTFVEAKYAKKERDSVKLHITLMRSKMGDNGKRESFDARPILKNFADYVFGTISVRDIHISIRRTESENGYYKPSFVLSLVN